LIQTVKPSPVWTFEKQVFPDLRYSARTPKPRGERPHRKRFGMYRELTEADGLSPQWTASARS
jgi:hypothetical protein